VEAQQMDDDGLVDPHPDDPDDGRHTMRLTERLRGGKRKQSQGEGLLQDGCMEEVVVELQ